VNSIGHVTTEGPIVRLVVRGPEGTEREIEVLLDTGFNGVLALPVSLVDDLALLPLGRKQITLASGEPQLTRKYEGTVRFVGAVQSVESVHAGTPLVGMGLLWGYDLRIQCIPNGSVAVESPSQEGG
jgi:clan AA aspartic protease